MDPGRLDRAARVLESAVANRDMDGAVLLIARHGKVVLHRAFGKRDGNAVDAATGQPYPGMQADGSLNPDPTVPMPVDGIFDLASMTKPFTAFLALAMDQDEASYPGFSIDDPVSDYIPSFGADTRKRAMKVRDLMRYASGFDIDTAQALYDAQAVSNPWQHMIAEPVAYETGTSVVYSDLGYRLLGYVLQEVGGRVPLQVLMERTIFKPLGMVDTAYQPFKRIPGARDRFVGNKFSAERGYYPRGQTIDENDTYAESFVLDESGLTYETGCDGLFSTVWDLALFQQMMLNHGVHIIRNSCPVPGDAASADAVRLLPAKVAEAMTEVQTTGIPDPAPTSTFTSNLLMTHKAYAWEKPESGAWPGGEYFTARSYSKTGGSGTLVVVHPELDYFFILLTNRGYPDFDFFVDDQGALQWPGFEGLIGAMHAEEIGDLIRQSIR